MALTAARLGCIQSSLPVMLKHGVGGGGIVHSDHHLSLHVETTARGQCRWSMPSGVPTYYVFFADIEPLSCLQKWGDDAPYCRVTDVTLKIKCQMNSQLKTHITIYILTYY